MIDLAQVQITREVADRVARAQLLHPQVAHLVDGSELI
jgi:hypothetical protein